MKVAMVTDFPGGRDGAIGGVVSVAKNLADEFAKMPDLELTVVVPHGTREDEVVREKHGGLVVYRLPRRRLWRLLPGTVYDIVAGKRQLARFLRTLAPDIVHFQGATFLAAGCEIRSVLTILGVAERDAIWDPRWGALRSLRRALLKLTEEYGLRRSPRVILNSDYLGRALNIRSRKVWRIDNPVPDAFFDVRREAEKGRIFCCSRVTPLKNIAGLIEAVGHLARRAPNCALRIAGSGDENYLETCRSVARKAGVGGKVLFLGALSPAEVRRELSKAHCFAHATFQEASGLSVAEAMAAGVPVVASRVGGIPEMVEHGSTGLLVDPNDPRNIADALARLLSDDHLARSIAHRGKAAVRGRFTASAVARRTADVYREILGEEAA